MYENEEGEVESDEECSRYSPPIPTTPAPVLPPPLPARVRNVATTLPPATDPRKDEPVFDLENEADGDCEMSQQMTASYSEISFKSNQSTGSEDVQPSLDLDKIDSVNMKEPMRQRPATLVCEKQHKSLGPLYLEGKVHVEGNITFFEAEDLEQKIKLSSPIAKKEDLSPLAVYSRSGTPNKLYRQILAPQMIQVDSILLHDLEVEARRLATSIDGLTENLCGILHSISSITADNIDIYKDAVSKMSDSMDANIKSMYTILAKAEEITKVMKSVQNYSVQVKEIKRLVDLFETYV